MKLAKTTWIITGASRGIGRALALALAEKGAKLVLNARHAGPLAEVAAEIRDLGSAATYVEGSAAHPSVAADLVKAATQLGHFTGFIHNAGVLHAGPLLWELPEPHWDEVYEASVKAAYQLIRFAVPELQRIGAGVAVFFGSGAAESNVPGIGAYAVAKAAEEHLARQLAAEAPEIISFAFRPGVVETRMQQEAREAQGGGAETLHRIFRGYKDQGVLLTPEEAAARLVRILETDPARFQGKVASWRDG